MFTTPTSRGGRGRSARAAFRTGDKLIFPMARVPLGWVLDTTHNDKALRIVNTTGGGSGGTAAFSTVFARTASDATTITTATMASHTHSLPAVMTNQSVSFSVPSGAGVDDVLIGATGSSGGDGSHTHGVEMRVQYVDSIIGRKL